MPWPSDCSPSPTWERSASRHRTQPEETMITPAEMAVNTWNRNLTLLDEMWDRLLTIELIAEAMVSCGASDDATAVWQRMEKQNWNQIGFREAREQGGGAVIGYLTRSDLTGRLGNLTNAPVRPFSVKELVSEHTSIRDCLLRLTHASRLFVLGPSGVDRVVTIADLQKQPVRIMLFGTISLLDMAMLSTIKGKYPNNRWADFLNKPRLHKAEALHRERHNAGHDTELADCLELCDKSDILTQTAADRTAVGFASHKQCKKFFNRVERLRDNLAHGQDPTEVADWSTICSLLARSEELVRQLAQGQS